MNEDSNLLMKITKPKRSVISFQQCQIAVSEVALIFVAVLVQLVMSCEGDVSERHMRGACLAHPLEKLSCKHVATCVEKFV